MVAARGTRLVATLVLRRQQGLRLRLALAETGKAVVVDAGQPS